MKKGLTEVVFVLDRSGSMAGLESDTIGGFNGMLEKQRKLEGDVLISTVLFDHESEVIHDRVNINGVNPLTDKEYYVRGCTALLDALGNSIHHIKNVHKYIREEDVPEHTVFIIVTDGMENASHKYNNVMIKKMVEEQQGAGWEFIFMGANIDSFATAANYGIREENVSNYHHDKMGTAKVFEAAAEAVCYVRSAKPLTRQWKKSVESDFNERKR